MTQYTLKLSFDLRQVTQSLAYAFLKINQETPNENTDYPMEGGGPLAGTFNFQKGDDIFVEVVATSALYADAPKTTSKDILQSFTVTNCTFVSIPARMTEVLSFFEANSACQTLDKPQEWEPLKPREDQANNLLHLSCKTTAPLPVTTPNGQWQISGYLSVELTSADGTTRPQLYFFDPEGSTGNGGGWN